MDISQGMLPEQTQQQMQQPIQPEQGQQQALPMGQKPPERDYESNPLNETDKDNIDKFITMGTRLIHSPETKGKVLERIEGIASPYTEVADAAYGVINRVLQQGKKEGKPFDTAVLIMGGTDIVGQVIELAEAANKLPAKPNEDDIKVITANVVKKYYQERIASGEISKEEAARDAQLATSAQATQDGEDLSGVQNDIEGIEKKHNEAMNGSKMGANGLKVPTPQNAFNPQATMKDVLAADQGGLLK